MTLPSIEISLPGWHPAPVRSFAHREAGRRRFGGGVICLLSERNTSRRARDGS